MKPSRSSRCVPLASSSPFGPGDLARRDPRPLPDPEQIKPIELIVRVLVACVAEDPFGPRLLPPLLESVRNALGAPEHAREADHEPSDRPRGTAGAGWSASPTTKGAGNGMPAVGR